MLNEALQTEGCFAGPFDIIRITMLRDRVARGVVIGRRNCFETTFARKALRQRKCVYTSTARLFAPLLLHPRSLIPPRWDHDI